MTCSLYILKCFKKDGTFKYYKGISKHPKKRLEQHKKGSNKRAFTKQFKGNIELVYVEQFKTRSEARRREIEVKKFDQNQIKELISN